MKVFAEQYPDEIRATLSLSESFDDWAVGYPGLPNETRGSVSFTLSSWIKSIVNHPELSDLLSHGDSDGDYVCVDILEDIWQSIHAATFIVADITGRNPNVLYELGIAHTLAKPVLILSKNSADIPIDLATRRVLLYGQTETDWQADLAAKMRLAMDTMVQAYITPPAS